MGPLFDKDSVPVCGSRKRYRLVPVLCPSLVQIVSPSEAGYCGSGGPQVLRTCVEWNKENNIIMKNILYENINIICRNNI